MEEMPCAEVSIQLGSLSYAELHAFVNPDSSLVPAPAGALKLVVRLVRVALCLRRPVRRPSRNRIRSKETQNGSRVSWIHTH